MFGASDEDWQVYQLIRGEQGDSDDEETLQERVAQLDMDITEMDEDWKPRVEYQQLTKDGGVFLFPPYFHSLSLLCSLLLLPGCFAERKACYCVLRSPLPIRLLLLQRSTALDSARQRSPLRSVTSCSWAWNAFVCQVPCLCLNAERLLQVRRRRRECGNVGFDLSDLQPGASDRGLLICLQS